MNVTKRPELESYEAFFNDNPSESTVATIRRIRKDVSSAALE